LSIEQHDVGAKVRAATFHQRERERKREREKEIEKERKIIVEI